MNFHTNSVEQTKKIAYDLAQKVLSSSHNVLIALRGEMGAGKTTFAQGFAQGLGINKRVLSPTFILMRQYPLSNSLKIFYHIDLYRLGETVSMEEIGLHELIQNKDAIVLIEWSEKLKEKLPPETIIVHIYKVSETEREIVVENGTE